MYLEELFLCIFFSWSIFCKNITCLLSHTFSLYFLGLQLFFSLSLTSVKDMDRVAEEGGRGGGGGALSPVSSHQLTLTVPPTPNLKVALRSLKDICSEMRYDCCIVGLKWAKQAVKQWLDYIPTLTINCDNIFLVELTLTQCNNTIQYNTIQYNIYYLLIFQYNCPSQEDY